MIPGNNKATSPDRKQGGFTLIEIMLALAIGSLVSVVILTIYRAQQRTYISQEQVSEVQQNIRAGLGVMVRESRMAAFNPSGSTECVIDTASRGRFVFLKDLNESGTCPNTAPFQPNEFISFGYPVADDASNDGIPDSGPQALGMQTNGSGYQSIAENIQAIEFLYILEDGTRTTGLPIDTALSAADIDNIRAVRISMLARASQADQDFSNTSTYTPASITALDPVADAVKIALLQVGWGPFNDNFRRRLMITTVQIRNMGL